MAIIEKLRFLKKKLITAQYMNFDKVKIFYFSKISYLAIAVTFFFIFSIVLNSISNKQLENENNFKTVSKSKEFLNFTSYFFSRIKRPY